MTNATHTLARELVWAGQVFPVGTAVEQLDEPRSGGYFNARIEQDGHAWFVALTEECLTPIEPDDKTTAELAAELTEATKTRERIERAATPRTLLELVDNAISGAWAHAAGDIDPMDVRAEIARRLELIQRYGGTEASNIKAILATGAPLAGWVVTPETARQLPAPKGYVCAAGCGDSIAVHRRFGCDMLGCPCQAPYGRVLPSSEVAEITDPPRHPQGTPEYEAYKRELRDELDKWNKGDAPYPTRGPWCRVHGNEAGKCDTSNGIPCAAS